MVGLRAMHNLHVFTKFPTFMCIYTSIICMYVYVHVHTYGYVFRDM